MYVPVKTNCQYSVAQMCTQEECSCLPNRRALLNDVMSRSELTVKCFQNLNVQYSDVPCIQIKPSRTNSALVMLHKFLLTLLNVETDDSLWIANRIFVRRSFVCSESRFLHRIGILHSSKLTFCFHFVVRI